MRDKSVGIALAVMMIFWIDQAGPGAYIAISTGAGSADWNKVD